MGWRDWVAVGLVVGILAVKVILVMSADDSAPAPGGEAGDLRTGGGELAATVSLAETLGGADTVGYARAVEPRPFVFPADHGPHPDFRTEWWYVTSNLDAADGRRFGFQFTIFRSALAPPYGAGVEEDGSERGAGASSAWSTRQMYLGHFTLTDVANRRFTEFERFTRGAAGLAGAWAEGNPGSSSPLIADSAARSPVRVWLDDWELRSVPTSSGGDDGWPLHLAVSDAGVALELTLEPVKPVVLQGDRGLSQKGPERGNASYYYSYTRLAAEGTVTVGPDTIPVSGLAWMDREWSTSALAEGQRGWDWFSLQLGDGSELMVYQIRGADGGASPESEGVWIAPDGTTTRLEAGDYDLTPTDRWTSPVDGAVYPSGWRIQVPTLEVDLRVEPVLEDQELNVTFRYWEGAVDVTGSRAGTRVEGRGYVELTGYAEESAGPGS